MTNEKTIETLNDLLTKAYDAEQGYDQAAERASSSPMLAQFFKDQSSLRLTIGKGLKSLISKYGGEPDKGASVAAKAHQIWITMRDFVEGGDDEAVLKECEKGEEKALEEYNEAMATPGLPADVLETLSEQRSKISDALEAIRLRKVQVD